jgi:Flp pilus assembly protein TadD
MTRRLHDYGDELLRVPVVKLGEVEDPYALGVDLESPNVERHGYVQRDREPELRKGLQDALGQSEPVLVVVSGPSNAGKTRMLYEVARKLGDAYVVAPHNKQSLKKLTEPGRLSGLPDNADSSIILWLEDLELYVGMTGEEVVSPRGLRMLRLAGRRKIILLATEGGKARSDLSHKDASRIRNRLAELLRFAQTRIDLKNEMTSAEIERAKAGGYSQEAIEQIKREGIGEYMIAAPELIGKLNTACHPGETNTCWEGAAVVLAAIDWRRAGLLRPIPRACLEKLYPYYLKGVEPNRKRLKTGIEWGERELYVTSRLLFYETSGASSDISEGYQPHDAVVQYIQETHKESVPDETFDTIFKECIAEEHADTHDLLSLGLAAYYENLVERAELCLRLADEKGSALGAWVLGLLLVDRGDVDGAEAAFRHADDRGDAEGAYSLGVLLDRERGDVNGAKAAYHRADERGSAKGAHNLGVLLAHEGGDLDEAEAALRRADERGSAESSHSLGMLLEIRGDEDGAEAAYRRADERGDADGAYRLGALLERRGDVDGAEASYRRADERGDAESASRLGVLLTVRGDKDDAAAAFSRADERGSAEGAFGLGVLLEGRGDVKGAWNAYRRADERGSPQGAYNLGALLLERGDFDEAEAAFRRGDERGSAESSHSLGLMLKLRGDVQGAEAANWRAKERGFP